MVALGVTTAKAATTSNPPASPDAARAMAAQNAASLVASRPAYLMASANDTFVQGNVVSSGSVQYVPYERNYRGVPVIGGDFVLVMSGGQVVAHSVAQQQP